MNLQHIIEESEKEFDEKFGGQSELSQAILSAMEYRGFDDCGKCLDDDISKSISPILKSHNRQFALKLIAGVREMVKSQEVANPKSTFANSIDEYIWHENNGVNKCVYKLLSELTIGEE